MVEPVETGLPEPRSRSTRSAPATACRTRTGIVPVEDKAEFIQRLLAAGLPVVEATSFVHPKWVPQLADAGELMERLGEPGEGARPVLVPNERGLDRALELGCRHIAIFGSATETFAQRNLNRSLDEQFAMFEPTVDAGARGRARRPRLREHVLRRPLGGRRPDPRRWSTVGKRLFDLGASQLSLGDTIGVGTAGHVRDLLDGVQRRRAAQRRRSPCTSTTPTARRSPTRYAALQHGITTFDASAGGLGGCPYAESATGNLATEDLVWMLHGLGHRDRRRPRLAGRRPAAWMAGVLGRPSPSRVVQAYARQRLTQSASGTMPRMSSRRVYLHVGTPEERHQLSAGQAGAQPGRSSSGRGWTTSDTRTGNHFEAALDLIGERWAGEEKAARGQWDALAQDARTGTARRADQPRDPRRGGRRAAWPARWPPSPSTRCTSSSPRATSAGRSRPSGRSGSSTAAARDYADVPQGAARATTAAPTG